MGIESFERLGRLILWLTIASVCVLVPIEYVKQHTREGELRDEAKKAQDRADELTKEMAAKPGRLPLETMGMYLSSISNSSGNIWFTNVSPNAGTICAIGIATNASTHRSSESLPSCLEVAAYASDVHMAFMFAGAELSQVCPESSCQLAIKEAPEVTRKGGT
jgi:hypothetical protein